MSCLGHPDKSKTGRTRRCVTSGPCFFFFFPSAEGAHQLHRRAVPDGRPQQQAEGVLLFHLSVSGVWEPVNGETPKQLGWGEKKQTTNKQKKVWTSFDVQPTSCLTSNLQDAAKLKPREGSDPVEPEAVSNMVRYARKCIREFRAHKSSNYILPVSFALASAEAGAVAGLGCWRRLDSAAPPGTLLEMCEQSLDEMGAVFHDSNVYMLHMMYQAMGVCLYMDDRDGAIRYGEKVAKYYRC